MYYFIHIIIHIVFLQWLSKSANSPFFGFLHFCDGWCVCLCVHVCVCVCVFTCVCLCVCSRVCVLCQQTCPMWRLFKEQNVFRGSDVPLAAGQNAPMVLPIRGKQTHSMPFTVTPPLLLHFRHHHYQLQGLPLGGSLVAGLHCERHRDPAVLYPLLVPPQVFAQTRTRGKPE